MSAGGPQSLRPGTPIRRLPNVLRQGLADREPLRLVVGTVSAIPDATHVTVTIADPLEDPDAGADIVVARLSSYVPVVGDPVYLLVGGLWSLAIGTVK